MGSHAKGVRVKEWVGDGLNMRIRQTNNTIRQIHKKSDGENTVLTTSIGWAQETDINRVYKI